MHVNIKLSESETTKYKNNIVMNTDNQSLFTSGKVALKNGETLYVHIEGTGPALFMIHGMWLDHRCFSLLFPHLKEKFTLIAPDFRGHGQSSYVTPVKNVDDLVEDVTLLIEHLKLDKVSFFGWCGGSSVAMKYASAYPEKVDRIVISSPPWLEGLPLFKPGKEKGEKVLLESKKDLATHPPLQLLSKAILEKDRFTLRKINEGVNFNLKKPPQEVIDSLVDQSLLTQNVEDLAWAGFTCNLTDRKKGVVEGSGEILKVQAKVLLFYGEDDSLVPLAAIDEYFDYLGENVTLKVIEDGGHAVHLLYPKEVSEDVLTFFA